MARRYRRCQITSRGKMSDSNWHADGQLWPTIKPPLVPNEEDVELVLRACMPALQGLARPPRILVLGVTPALLDAAWPEGSELHSVDYDRVMIDVLWKEREGRTCHCDNWQSMPFPDRFFDLVVGDCSFNALPGLDDYAPVLQEIVRVSRPGAPFVSRFFMQPEPRLTLGTLPAATGGIEVSSGVRLLLAIASAGENGSLRFTDVFGLIAAEGHDFEDYMRGLRHGPADIERTRKILESDQRLNYPSWPQIAQAFGPFYSRSELEHPGYDVGRYCPIVRFS
jgi:SAM-dependent methyltransferase